MERIEIETAQNVTLEFDVASIGDRVIAQLIDFVVYFAYIILILVIFVYLSDVFGSDIWIIFSLFMLPLMFYSVIFEGFLQGQTLGKFFMKIRVAKLDGSQVTILDCFTRWILRLIDIWLFTGVVAIISVLANGKGQRLGDIAAGTTVLSLRQRPIFKDSVFRFIPKNYQLKYQEVKILNDNDIYIVNEVINAYSRLQNEASVLLLKKTATRVADKIDVIYNQHKDHPRIFLETIVKDYNFVNQEDDQLFN